MTRRVHEHARVVAHQPRTPEGERLMNVVRLPHPSRPAKLVLPQLAQQIDDLSSSSGEGPLPPTRGRRTP